VRFGRSGHRSRKVRRLGCLCTFTILPLLLLLNIVPTSMLTFVTGTCHDRRPSRPSRVEGKLARQFFSGESEVERLRQENAELKQKLQRSSKLTNMLASASNLCSRAVEGVKDWFGGRASNGGGAPSRQQGAQVDWFNDRDSRDSALMPGSSSAPSLFASLFGSLFKLAFGDVASNIDAVRSAAAEVVEQSGHLGPTPRVGPVMSQSYSSININGHQTSSVNLQFQMTGESRSGIVSCQATIASGEVSVRDIRLDGRPVEISKASGFIDV